MSICRSHIALPTRPNCKAQGASRVREVVIDGVKILRMVTYWEQHADCGRRVFRLLLTTLPATCGMHCASPCPSSITHLIMWSTEYTYRWSARIFMQQIQGCGFSVSDCVHALNLMFFFQSHTCPSSIMVTVDC